MSSRRRRPRRSRRPRESDRPGPLAFFRRRSTRWLIAAIITLAIGITLGVIAGDDEGEPEPAPTPTVTVLRVG